MSNKNYGIRKSFECRVKDSDAVTVEPTDEDRVWMSIREEGEGENFFVISKNDANLLARLITNDVERTDVKFACSHQREDKFTITKSYANGWCFAGWRDGDNRTDVILSQENCNELAEFIRPSPEKKITFDEPQVETKCNLSNTDCLTIRHDGNSVIARTTGGNTVWMSDEGILDAITLLANAYNKRNEDSDLSVTHMKMVEVEETVTKKEIQSQVLA
jgi:hypothetical protein